MVSTLVRGSTPLAKLAVLSFLTSSVLAKAMPSAYTPPNRVEQYTYYGCVNDPKGTMLDGLTYPDGGNEPESGMTLDWCAITCEGYNYFGVENAKYCEFLYEILVFDITLLELFFIFGRNGRSNGEASILT